MTTIFERVNTALATISPPVPASLAPYKSNTTLPDKFIAYQLIVGTPELSADDAEVERSYLVQVSIFSRAGLVSLPDVDTAMTAAGFVKGRERQLPQDPQTGHYGLAKEYTYL
jgi:hypothetical protein